MDKLNRTDAEWRAKLTPEQYRILRVNSAALSFAEDEGAEDQGPEETDAAD